MAGFTKYLSRLLSRESDDLEAIVNAVLDRQDDIEARSFDSATGRMAVFAARRALEPVFQTVPPGAQRAEVTRILEALQERQKANKGDYSTGAATIGSILSAIRSGR